ncbi:MAG: NuA4 histone acetyltransferase subunit [Vezdaea aestivalis]|nr:MAG: NuA4 histone acetyltransferase subunit [Vezdaea aestivalis]
MAPASAEYGGDEVAAIVLDPGYSSVRAGFAGEDVPKSVLLTDYGMLDDKRIFGYDSLQRPREKFEIVNPFSKDGLIEDWESATQLFEHAITSRLIGRKPESPKANGLNEKKKQNGGNGDTNSDEEMEDAEEIEKPLEENPLLMSEPGWNPPKSREKCVEIAMENWGAPAFWIARTGVLSTFAAGKSTALVIDVGASNLSVTPVYEGNALRKGTQHSPLAGNFISSQVRHLFNTYTPTIKVHPHYEVRSKTPVDALSPAQAQYTKLPYSLTKSFSKFHEDRILHEFKEHTAQVYSSRLAPQGQIVEEARTGMGRSFELPDGFNAVFGLDRFRVVEGIWDAKQVLVPIGTGAPSAEGESSSEPATNGYTAPTTAQTIPAMVREALSNVDIDARPTMLANVVVVGGSSLLYGFTDRLHWELQQLYPTFKIRIHAAGNTVERKFSSWLGGSILSSLGTFHQVSINFFHLRIFNGPLIGGVKD